MSYSDGEALIYDLVSTMPEFNTGNAARQNWRVLNQGYGSVYAILRPGGFTNEYEGMGRRRVIRHWRTIIEVHQQWTNATPDTTPLQEHVVAVLHKLERYPYLGNPDRIIRAEPSAGNEMLEKVYFEGGPVWAVWEIYIDWQEEESITPAE